MSFALAFRRELPFGPASAIHLPSTDDFTFPEELHPDEARHAARLPPGRRATFVGGRLALRDALAAAGVSRAERSGAILPTARGAPRLPPGLLGSISHKHRLAVALAARADPGEPAALGIDVEIQGGLRHDIARRILTDEELAALGDRGRPDWNDQVLWHFAAKEAIYKALDPWVGRLIGFREVSLARGLDGSLAVHLALTGGEGPFLVDLHDGSEPPGQGAALILVAARVIKRPG
jgi:4'-phosphopantetheinyl transferase EntD